jgi:hypothetical protein
MNETNVIQSPKQIIEYYSAVGDIAFDSETPMVTSSVARYIGSVS